MLYRLFDSVVEFFQLLAESHQPKPIVIPLEAKPVRARNRQRVN